MQVKLPDHETQEDLYKVSPWEVENRRQDQLSLGMLTLTPRVILDNLTKFLPALGIYS